MINLFYKYFLLAQKMMVWSVLCNVIRSLMWGKFAHFTCITKGWYVFCPCWCAVVFSAQLFVFCDSFLMELGLGTAVPSISFIFLWQRVLAWIQILKSWRRSAEALRDTGFHPEQKLFLFLWSCISRVNIHQDFCAWGNSVAFSASEVQLCVCVLWSSEMSLLRAAYTLQLWMPSLQRLQALRKLLSEHHWAASHAPHHSWQLLLHLSAPCYPFPSINGKVLAWAWAMVGFVSSWRSSAPRTGWGAFGELSSAPFGGSCRIFWTELE